MSSRSVLEVHSIGVGQTRDAEGPPRWDAAYLSHTAPKWQPKLHTCIACRRGHTKAHMAIDGVHCLGCYKPAPLVSLSLRSVRKLTEGEAATRMSRRWMWEGKHTVTCACEVCA